MAYYKDISNQPLVAQLQQLTELTWDGDLIGKDYRDDLVKKELALRINGWNIITEKGIVYLETLGFITKNRFIK
jgi:hypothetical protein